jgi:hypothetical protein
MKKKRFYNFATRMMLKAMNSDRTWMWLVHSDFAGTYLRFCTFAKSVNVMPPARDIVFADSVSLVKSGIVRNRNTAAT